ncbi:MAG TPA: alanine racemase [Microbacteriaceae bacterium]|nr:alanine racemase [Microbacteriaceae bacterium]
MDRHDDTLAREARIDLDALQQNARTLAERVAPARLLAVVKADAYGHGMVRVASALEETGVVGALGVVDLDEARLLRRAGIALPILAWMLPAEADLRWAIVERVELGISDVATLERLARAATAVRAFATASMAEPPTAIVHLKADTGLGRAGATAADWPELVARAAEFERAGLIEVRGVWSHLANASTASDAAQFEAFDAALRHARQAGLTPSVEHLAASQAVLTYPAQRRDLVRVGIALYGISPFAGRPASEFGLRPVMRLGGTVLSVKRVPAGHGVSYGHRYVTERETTLALVPLGYADGLPRSARRPPVWINGTRYTVAGTIAMDQVVVDVGDDPVAVGDLAVFWGDPALGHPSAQDWADAVGTIPYEIVTRVGPRVPRRPA